MTDTAETAKELRAYFHSDEFLKAKEIAGNSIKKMNIMFDKAEKYDQIKEIWNADVNNDLDLDGLKKSLDKINSIITSERRTEE